MEPLYTKVDLSDSNHELLELRRSPKEILSEVRMTVSLAFAPYSSKLAYLTQSGDSIDLWISDLDLKDIEHLWKNEQEWVDASLQAGDAYIRWGPSDSSLILSSYLLKDRFVLVSLENRNALEFKGRCDRIAPIPDTNQLTVWCTFSEGADAPNAYLDLDGDIVLTDVMPQEGVEVNEWVFTENGQRIAYAPKDENVMISNESGNNIELLIRILRDPSELARTQPVLQWSEDGERLLVHGYNEEQCPLRVNGMSGELEPRDCWIIVDGMTGEIQWGFNMSAELIQQAVGYPHEIAFDTSAVMSPNNDWIILNYHSGAISDVLLVETIPGGKVILFDNANIMDAKWIN
jgi:hypothetical protein